MKRILTFLCIILSQGLFAQSNVLLQQKDPTAQKLDIHPPDVVRWQGQSASILSDGRVEVGVRLVVEGEWTIYTDKLEISGPPGFSLESMDAPPTKVIPDPMSKEDKPVYFGGDFIVRFSGPSDALNGKFNIKIKYLGCTTRICLFPYTEELSFKVFANPASTGETKQEGAEALPTSTAPDALIKAPTKSADLEVAWAEQISSGDVPLALMLLVIFIGGLATNLTPCVLPMIPITLRLLGGKGEKTASHSMLYALGIFATYTVLGVFAALSGSLFGGFLSNPWVNVGFAILMFVLGLNMLGYGNLSGLQNLGQRLGAGKPSARNAFLMGCGAGFVAAPCTGPILAALLAHTAKTQDISQGSLMLGVYSFGFALPYVVLGRFAGKVGKISLNVRVINLVKVVFGAVMFALGFYYLRVPAYGFLQTIKPYWMEIMSGTAIASASALSFWLASKRARASHAFTLALCVLLGSTIFSATQYLSAGGKQEQGSASVAWIKSIDQAMLTAKETSRPLLIDAWAEWCEACKKMDRTTFIDPVFLEAYADGKWLTLKYDMTEMNDEHLAFQQKYAISGLPSLVMIQFAGGDSEPRITVLSGYQSGEGLQEKMRAFVSGKAE